MRCKQCDYPLWNLRARQCPECGGAFVPSEFTFVPNSVQFCCPHCDQSYYGTDERGHLVPQEFECVSCQQRISMNEAVLRPTQGVREEQTQVDRMPWLDRKRLGWLSALVQTACKTIGNPISLGRSIPPDSGTLQAWMFALLVNFGFLLVGLALPIGAWGAFLVFTGDRSGVHVISGSALGFLGYIGAIGVVALLWALFVHGFLRMTGGAEHGLGRSLQAMLYSSGANFMLMVPCLGPYCGGFLTWIPWSVVAIMMLCEMQKVHAGRATLAVLSLPIICGAIAFAGYLVLISSVIGGVTGGPFVNTGTRTFSPLTEVDVIGESMNQYAMKHNGIGPQHALQLMSEGIVAGSFVSRAEKTDVTAISIGETTLDRFDYLPPNRKERAISAAVDALPPNVIAHRVGDFVFTHHGMDWRTADPELWTVIYWPDPDFNPRWFAARDMYIISTPTQDAKLVYGAFDELPPLPHPSQITHSSPAVPADSMNQN